MNGLMEKSPYFNSWACFPEVVGPLFVCARLCSLLFRDILFFFFVSPLLCALCELEFLRERLRVA